MFDLHRSAEVARFVEEAPQRVLKILSERRTVSTHLDTPPPGLRT